MKKVFRLFTNIRRKMSIPNEYKATPAHNMYAGTDIYLAAGAAIWTAMIMNLFMNTVATVYNFSWHQNVVYMAMAVPSLISAYNVLIDNTNPPRRRVSSALAVSLNLVFISPLTVLAQIGQSVTNGVNITRQLFD